MDGGGRKGWMDGRRNRWQYRRLIMPFEKRWRRKAVWEKNENLSISVPGWKRCSGIVTKHLDSHLRLIVYMSIRNLQQSQKCSKKFISWAPAILSDECDSCAARVDWCVCVYVCVFQCVSSGTVKAWLSNLEKWKSDFPLIHTRTRANHSVRAFVSWWIAAGRDDSTQLCTL